MNKSKNFPINRRLFVLLIILLGVLGAYSLSRSVMHDERIERRISFETAATNSAHSFKRVIERTETVLLSLTSFFYSSDHVSRSDFMLFVERDLARNPGIQALAYLPQITGAKRAWFLLDLKKEGFDEFKISEISAAGNLIPASGRDAYYPMLYIEPFGVHNSSLGFDVGSNADQLAAMQMAARNNRWIASPHVTLKKGITNESAVFLFAPMFKTRISATERPKQWQEDLNGFALAVLNIDNLMSSAFQTMKFDPNFSLYLYDATEEATPHLLSSWGPGTAGVQPLFEDLSTKKLVSRFQLGGREWRLVAIDTEVGTGALIALVLFYSVLAASTFLAIFLGMHLSRNETITKRVVFKTAQLEHQRDQLERTLLERNEIIKRFEDKLEKIKIHDLSNPLLLEGLNNLVRDEFRMPLLKIDTAALKLSRTGQNDLSEELSSLVLSIRQSTSHVMNLLNSLMKATEAEANEKPRHILRPVWFDVRHVLLACCLRQQELTETQLISREIPETAEHIFTDPKLFEIMIGGLISSCLRFAPTSPHLLVRLISDEDSVSIELKFSPLPLNEMAWNDSSKGLFDALGSGMKGFELQLGLCKQFLELQGGTMEVSIDKGRGASLILTLPRHFTEQAGADDKAAA